MKDSDDTCHVGLLSTSTCVTIMIMNTGTEDAPLHCDSDTYIITDLHVYLPVIMLYVCGFS